VHNNSFASKRCLNTFSSGLVKFLVNLFFYRNFELFFLDESISFFLVQPRARFPPPLRFSLPPPLDYGRRPFPPRFSQCLLSFLTPYRLISSARLFPVTQSLPTPTWVVPSFRFLPGWVYALTLWGSGFFLPFFPLCFSRFVHRVRLASIHFDCPFFHLFNPFLILAPLSLCVYPGTPAPLPPLSFFSPPQHCSS